MIEEMKQDTNDDSYPLECVIESSSGVTINDNTVLTAKTYCLGNQVDFLGELYEYTWYRDKKSRVVIGKGKTLRVTPTYRAKYSRWKILRFYVVVTEPEKVTPSKMETTTKIVEVPQIVADFIKERTEDENGDKPESNTVYNFISNCHHDFQLGYYKGVSKWFHISLDNQKKLESAWLYGYTIEQPKLLTVIVKDYDKTIMSKQMPEDDVNKMMGRWVNNVDSVG